MEEQKKQSFAGISALLFIIALSMAAGYGLSHEAQSRQPEFADTDLCGLIHLYADVFGTPMDSDKRFRFEVGKDWLVIYTASGDTTDVWHKDERRWWVSEAD